jgi:regulator of ribonuclease activity A
MTFTTADLHDANEGKVRIALPGLHNFGGRRKFHGPIATVRVHEDNALVRAALEQQGAGRVLVIDGGGSLRCALVGDKLAELGRKNGWAGIIVNGCIRDSVAIAGMDMGVKALAATPARSGKCGTGEQNRSVTFLDVTFRPGEFVYADEDGTLLSSEKLL